MLMILFTNLQQRKGKSCASHSAPRFNTFPKIFKTSVALQDVYKLITQIRRHTRRGLSFEYFGFPFWVSFQQFSRLIY
jgi:hypothetical protein